VKPHLKSNGSKEGNKLLLDMLESGGANGMLEAMQTQLTESRHKAHQIESEAEQEAKNVTLKAHAEAATIRAKATRDAADIEKEAKLKRREIHRASTELEGRESALKYQRRQFNDETKEFKLAVSGLFERYLDSK
jgi:regulator of protease activity HflC (stomatin/prohibitin superfamily)